VTRCCSGSFSGYLLRRLGAWEWRIGPSAGSRNKGSPRDRRRTFVRAVRVRKVIVVSSVGGVHELRTRQAGDALNAILEVRRSFVLGFVAGPRAGPS